MNYEDMSDHKINRCVAEFLGHTPTIHEEKVFIGSKHHGDNVTSVMGVVDYCNNPSDMWPLIMEERICINPYEYESQWFATTDTSFFVDDINPLRAAAICWLKLKEEKEVC